MFSRCGPEGLLRQIRTAAAKYNVRVAGENALCRFDRSAYERVIKNARGEGDDVELWKTVKGTTDGVFYVSSNVRRIVRAV